MKLIPAADQSRNGYVARIERGELHIGDGLAFWYCGRLERLYSDGVYVYESSNSRFRMDAGES